MGEKCDRIKRRRHKLQYRGRRCRSTESEGAGKRGRTDQSGVINDSSAAPDALASSSYVADLGLMSCNKTWPSTPEIGPPAVMLGSLLLH